MTDIKHRKIWKRVLALVLAAAMIATIAAQGMVNITIVPKNEDDLATNYLIDQNEYMEKSKPQQVVNKLQSLIPAMSFNDYYNLANVQISEGEFEKALFSINKCIELLGSENEQEALYQLMIQKGCLQELTGQSEEAVETLQTVVAYSDDISSAIEALALLGQLYFVEGEYEKAVEAYEPLIQATAEDSDAMSLYKYLYGISLLQSGEYEKAAEALTDSLQQDGSRTDIHYYLGMCHLYLEDYEKASEDMTNAIDNESMVQSASYVRAICSLKSETPDLAAAREDLKRAVSYEGEDFDEESAAQAQDLLNQIS